jgi:Fe-S cluster assembly iron-binding protein IscA
MNLTSTGASWPRWQRALAAVGAISAMTLGIAVLPAGASSTAPQAGVVPPSARVDGMTYSQWSAALWQWTIETPDVASTPPSPVLDPNTGTETQPAPVNCALNQKQGSNVWFLAGTGVFQSNAPTYRSCSIPSGTFLFFPVVDAWNDNLSCPGMAPGTATADELRDNVQTQVDTIEPGSMKVTVDGRSVNGLTDSTTAYRAAANGFTYTLQAGNALSRACPGDPFPAGTSPPPPGAYADGVYIMLAPLSVGVHQISFAGIESGATEDVTYTITVNG